MTDELNTTLLEQSAPEPDGAGQQPETQARVFTQAEVDKLLGTARAEGRKAAQDAFAKQLGGAKLEDLLAAAAELSKRKESEMTEADKIALRVKELETQLAQKEQQKAEADLRALRLEVGQAKGLKPSLALVLQGATKEELEAHADTIIADMPVPPTPSRPVPPNLGPTEGNQGVPRPATRLSQFQKDIAARFGMSEEDYIKRANEGKPKEG